MATKAKTIKHFDISLIGKHSDMEVNFYNVPAKNEDDAASFAIRMLAAPDMWIEDTVTEVA